MRHVTFPALGIAFVLGLSAAPLADAHGGRHYGHGHRSSVTFGFYYGGPAYWHYPGIAYSYYYPYPYYAYRPVVVAPPAPTTYIERGDASTPPDQEQGYWYYCQAAQAYYPYVKQCAGGWQRVVPQPPPG